jgi:hypothetical protein
MKNVIYQIFPSTIFSLIALFISLEEIINMNNALLIKAKICANISVGFYITSQLFSCKSFMFLQKYIKINFNNYRSYHIVNSIIFVFFGCLHGILIGANLENDNKLVEINNRGYLFHGVNMSGVVLSGLLLVITFTSLKIIRNTFFELFYCLHYLSYCVYIFMIFHSKKYYILFILLLFVKIIDFVLIKQNTYKTTINKCEKSLKYITISFKQQKFIDENILRNSHLYICIPKISSIEWHPFSIAFIENIDNVQNITIVIKNVGDFTNKLFNDDNLIGCEIKYMGPFKTNCVYFTEKTAVISSGSNISTSFSYLKNNDWLFYFFDNDLTLFYITSKYIVDLENSKHAAINYYYTNKNDTTVINKNEFVTSNNVIFKKERPNLDYIIENIHSNGYKIIIFNTNKNIFNNCLNKCKELNIKCVLESY